MKKALVRFRTSQSGNSESVSALHKGIYWHIATRTIGNRGEYSGESMKKKALAWIETAEMLDAMKEKKDPRYFDVVIDVMDKAIKKREEDFHRSMRQKPRG